MLKSRGKGSVMGDPLTGQSKISHRQPYLTDDIDMSS